MRIIIVEDSPRLAVALRTVLEEQGHSVTWILGVSAIDSEKLQGYPGMWSFHFPRCCVDEVQLSDFDLAFVDGHLDGILDGPLVVPTLCAAGVHCIAISNDKGLNAKMCAAGASSSVLKDEVITFVSSDAGHAQFIGTIV